MLRKKLSVIADVLIIIMIGTVIAINQIVAIFFLPVLIILVLKIVKEIMILMGKYEYLSKLNRIIDISTYVMFVYIIISFGVFFYIREEYLYMVILAVVSFVYLIKFLLNKYK